MLLASPKLSAAFFVVMAGCALWARIPERSATLAMLLPFSLLTANLLAAIVTNRRFRADLPLLVFHLALLALVVTLVVARLTYFEGQATVTGGTAFDGKLISETSGALHSRRLDDLRFTNLGFTENYPERGHYHATYNRVRWRADGATHTADIGDDIPLILAGYRIYTTRHRGFSPVFRWQKTDGTDELGTVQLRDSNNGAFAGANEWQLPDGRQAWLMVDIEAPSEEQTGAHVRANLGAGSDTDRLILRVGDERHTLSPGEQLVLPEGTLTYVRLDSWMGYRIVADPTKPWLIGTIAVAVISLVWFYSRIVFRPLSAKSIPS
ncbi:cytochrome c biogenesis protein ResB [Azoarcus sp. KH32C]|uniref:cytochrome c biogenesis protein ResB n=1 Tax=Azoarcus sp. KH32C TaxID=748247 RepID=UPI0012EA406C|nr:cytochrome c biogenesis protein ResB [Azoarcus sp. KH32C]